MTPKPRMALDGSQEVWDELVPAHLQLGLARYLDFGELPGGFLTACLSNDLLSTVSRAHLALTLGELRNLMQFLFTCAPRESWGSPENVAGWRNHELRLELMNR